MHLRRWFFSLLFAGMAVGATPPAAILINVDIANPPFMYGIQGKAMGVYPRLIQAAFRHMDSPVLVEAKPWNRTLMEGEHGLAGVGGLYKNSERLTKFDYSDQLFVERLVVYFNMLKPVAFSGVEDLKGKRIGVIRGWSYGDDFDRMRKDGDFTVEAVASDEQNFRKLEAQRLDAVITIREAGAVLAPKFKDLGCAPTPLALNPTFLAFAKSAYRAALLKQFNSALMQMQKSGEFQKIIAEEFSR